MNHWTEEQIAELRKLRALGYSFSLIAEKIGRTMNACVAKADRIGMRVESPARNPKPVAGRNELADIIGSAPAGTRLVPLTELKSSTCRWPYGDPKSAAFGFCGCPCEEGKPYCAEHLNKAVVKRAMPKIRQRRERLHDVLDPRFDRWVA